MWARRSAVSTVSTAAGTAEVGSPGAVLACPLLMLVETSCCWVPLPACAKMQRQAVTQLLDTALQNVTLQCRSYSWRERSSQPPGHPKLPAQLPCGPDARDLLRPLLAGCLPPAPPATICAHLHILDLVALSVLLF